MLKVAPATSGPVCHQVQQQTATVCVTGSRPPGLGSGCTHTQPSVSAIQPGPSQEPVESEPTCLAPRASAIKEQGFSEAVAARIEAQPEDQPDLFMRQSGPFLQSGASVIRWTSGHHL